MSHPNRIVGAARLALALLALVFLGCDDAPVDPPAGMGGAGAGGATGGAIGGQPGAGGMPDTGGMPTGGTPGTGGMMTGGTPGAGGMMTMGGMTAMGGMTGMGGEPADPCAPNPCVDPPSPACTDDGTTAVTYSALGVCSDAGDGTALCDYEETIEVCEQSCVDGVCVVDPCAPNPCNAPPAPSCDGDTLVAYPLLGVCADEGGDAACDYAAIRRACPDACAEGACVGEASAPPLPGQVVISEIMYDPHDGLEDRDAEWLELYNAGATAVNLEGCQIADATASSLLEAVVIAPGGYALLAASADPEVNGGLIPDGLFDFTLNNTADDVTLTCDGVLVDQVRYNEEVGFPRARAMSISLHPDLLDAGQNDAGNSWCHARDTYLDGPQQWGTPGAANTGCEGAVGFCRLQHPTEIEAEFRAEVAVYGRVYVEGITDRTPGNDAAGLIVAQFGFGPDGSQPGDDDWLWLWARPNTEWNAAEAEAGEANNDEYQFNLWVPLPGDYDYVYRFSADGGRTYTLCDSGAGSTDGFDLADAGQMTALAPEMPCDPNPCNRPPVSTCEGNTAMVFPALGACGIAENGLAECTYAAEESDCTADGQICVNGRCLVERPLSPGAGDVVITELLYDPQAGLRESTGEWIEIFNPTDTLFNLNACELADSASGSPLSGLFIESGEYLVFGKSDDPAENGGLDVDGLFEFNLTNSGDVISIRCGETVVDVVNYGDESFPDASAASISLSGDLLDAAINDGGAAWCAATDVYLVDPEHRGTPGTANPVCDNEAILCEPNPCNAAPAPRCDGNIQIVSSAPGVCRVEQGVQTCEYPEERVPCANDAECREGVCVPLAARPVEAGDVVISEIMYDPDGGLAENSGEWFELQNLSDDVVSLDGCVVGDNSNETNIVGLFIVPRGYAVFGRTDDRGRNGGLDPDHLFDFSLNNVGDTITVRCGDVELDTVDFSLDSFPDARQATLNLDPAHADPLDNDDGLNWCPATSVYLAVPEHRGTPGGPNDACAFENPCEPNPCNEAPAARCEVGENIAISYGAQGQCVLDGRQATCEYPSQEEDCGPGNQVCVNGACIAADARAQVGEVVFTEVMYDPHHVLGDATAEWVELYNRSARALTLDECTFWNGREDSEPMVIADLLLEPGEFVVFAASQNEAENGGLAGVHQAFGFSLSNQGTSLTLNCGGDAIDRVRYDDGNLFPDARAASISLDPDAFDGDANDHGFNWCLARDTYFADPDGNAENDNLGTPGAVNPQCPAVDLTVDYCRFQFPDEVTVTVGQDLDVYGVVYEEGITDRSPQSDADRRLRAQAGYGPRGSDPTESPGWSWYEATTNAGWNGAIRDEPDNDEYITRLRPQEPGDYDLVYRFTLDTGLTWLLCDLGEGSGNGYSANDAAHLTVTADPCIPSPCGNPPLPTCEGNELLFYGGDGVCEAVDGEAVCTYPINIREDCGQNNQECDLDANGFAECQ